MSVSALSIGDGPELGPFDDAGLDPFRCLPERVRRDLQPRFVAAMRERDGLLDFEARRLSHRDAWFQQLDTTVRWKGPIDREAAQRSMHDRSARSDDPRSIWLIAAARGNQDESWGANLDIENHIRRGLDDADPAVLYILTEEQYHGRLLAEACRTLGVELESRPPAWPHRVMIRFITSLPPALRYVPVLVGEVLGTIVFQVLRERCDLFRDEPVVEAHLSALLDEILHDEILHVGYCRSQLGPVGMAVARRIAGPLAAALMIDVPELALLGCDRRELQRRLRSEIALPAELHWMSDALI